MLKRIKGSSRGLTFSLDESGRIGKKFRYVIDMRKNEILIIDDADGSMTVSRKRAGTRYKALYDLRSAEVRKLCAAAEYMEIERLGDEIVVHVYRKIRVFSRFLRRDVVCISDVLCEKSGEIRLAKASGYFAGQMSFEDIPYWDDIFTEYRGTEHEAPLKDVFTFVSVFSGAGLLDYAFVRAGYRGIWANDACILDGRFSPELAQTYSHNIGCRLTVRDIREVEAEEIPDSDIMIGGPCCQAYSNANRRNIETEEGSKKRHLVDDYARLAAAKQPKIIVIENVPQILSREQGKILETALASLNGYEFSSAVITDADVGGYTLRKRAIVLGSRIGAITVPDLALSVPRTVRDALSRIDGSWKQYPETESSPETKRIMSFVPEGGNWQDVPARIRQFGPSTQSNVYRRLRWDAPAPTLTNWRKCLLTHPSENRILNINEAAALMGLDRNFEFFGKTGAIQQMIGNGVTFAIGSFIEKLVTAKLRAQTS